MARKKFSRKAKIILGVCVATPILWYAWFFRDVLQADWEYEAIYEAAKREGAIVTPDDLRRRYGVRDEENAAPIILAVGKKWDQLPKDKKSAIEGFIYPPRSGVSSQNRTADPTAELVISALKPLLDELNSCQSKPKCDFHYRWEDNISVTFPQFAWIEKFALAAAQDGARLAADGHVADATDRFRLSLHLGKLAGDTPIAIAAFIRIKIDRIVLKEIALAAVRRPTDANLRRSLASILNNWAGPLDLTGAVEGEICLKLIFADQIIPNLARLSNQEGNDVVIRPPFADWPGVARSWKTRCFMACRETRAALIRTHGAPVELIPEEMRVVEAMSSKKREASHFMDAELGDHYHKLASYVTTTIAAHEVALATLEVLDERQRLGHWPDRLPVFRRDPFGSAELKYRVDGDHAVIWSIGVDHVDSQGRNSSDLPTPNDSKDDDIAVHL